jgi:hypothetical protein
MLFREDVAQMGAKSARKTGVADLGTEYGVKFEDVNENVYMHPEDYDPDKKDSSSFLLTNDDGFSDLTLRRIRYDDNGYFLAVEEVRSRPGEVVDHRWDGGDNAGHDSHDDGSIPRLFSGAFDTSVVREEGAEKEFDISPKARLFLFFLLSRFDCCCFYFSFCHSSFLILRKETLQQS